MAAELDRQPCALQLSATGWQPPLSGDLPACRGGVMSLVETGSGELELCSNLPDAVRFSTNGLVLDGGLVVLSHPAHGHALCLVIGLPLGISRSGVYRGDLNSSLSSALCLPKSNGHLLIIRLILAAAVVIGGKELKLKVVPCGMLLGSMQ